MSLEWKTVELKSIANVTMGQSPKSEFYNDNFEGMPFLQGNKTFGDKYPSFELYTTSIKKVAEKNSVLMSVRAPVGDLNIAQEDICIGRGVCGLQMKKGDNEFLYYLLKANISHLINKESGTVFGSINKNDIETFEVTLPKSSDDQMKILTILKNIDKKIDICKNLNRNLTELSHVLHKEFIKSIDNNGFCYYKEVKELGTIIMGQSPKGESYNYDNIGLPLINGAADYENGYLKAQKYTTDPKKTCDKNDLIFCIRATIGLLVICDKEYCLGRGVAGITNIDTLYKEYAFHLINSSIENFKRTATGSVISGISKKDIEEIPVRILTKDDMKKYHTIQKPIFDKLENNRIEIDNLIKLRDTLLPRLMSGEIDVSKINCDMQQISTNNWDNKFTVPLQNNLIKVIS